MLTLQAMRTVRSTKTAWLLPHYEVVVWVCRAKNWNFKVQFFHSGCFGVIYALTLKDCKKSEQKQT